MPWPTDLVVAVRAEVDAHRPGDEREAGARTRIVAALGRLARPFDEHASTEHVTASAVVVGGRGTVLHLHKRLGRWLQPGGHLHAGETPWAGARREAEEETGLAVSHPGGGPRLLHVDVHAAARGHVHLDLRYLLFAPDDDPAPDPGESPHVRWFAWDEALAVADVALVGALRAALGQPEVAASDGPQGRRGGTAPSDRHNGG